MYKYRMLGVVTLYNPEIEQVATNINLFLPFIDKLIIWDNSYKDKSVRKRMESLLQNEEEKVLWHVTGENLYIAPAIEFAWNYAKSEHYDFVLTMDQDSKWEDFGAYRKEIEMFFLKNILCVYTPYILGGDKWPICKEIQQRRIFINSGTVYPTKILNAIGGIDKRFPLDALDHDLSIRVQKAGFSIVCLTNYNLSHTMGNPTSAKWLPIKANNYSAWRTKEITRSQVLLWRKHRDWLTLKDKYRIIKDFFIMRILRIILLEDDKFNRIKMMINGIKTGITYKMTNEYGK